MHHKLVSYSFSIIHRHPCIETQNLGKDQALAALAAVAAQFLLQENIQGHFRTISGHFLANYMKSFHKKEVQTVILKCLVCLNPLIENKSYDILLVKIIFIIPENASFHGYLAKVSFDTA